MSYATESMAMSQNEAGPRDYLETILCTEYCVIAINIGLKTSKDLYTCFRRKTNQNVCVLVICTTAKCLSNCRLPLHAASQAHCFQW